MDQLNTRPAHEAVSVDSVVEPTPTPPSPPLCMTIRIAAAAILRGNEILLVRKQDKVHFMQPGGKIEPGEDPLSALKRELAEEIGFTDGEFSFVKTLRDIAVHEHVELICELYECKTLQEFAPHAEIAEVRWVHLANPGNILMAPLTKNQILPLYKP